MEETVIIMNAEDYKSLTKKQMKKLVKRATSIKTTYELNKLLDDIKKFEEANPLNRRGKV